MHIISSVFFLLSEFLSKDRLFFAVFKYRQLHAYGYKFTFYLLNAIKVHRPLQSKGLWNRNATGSTEMITSVKLMVFYGAIKSRSMQKVL